MPSSQSIHLYGKLRKASIVTMRLIYEVLQDHNYNALVECCLQVSELLRLHVADVGKRPGTYCCEELQGMTQQSGGLPGLREEDPLPYLPPGSAHRTHLEQGLCRSSC